MGGSAPFLGLRACVVLPVASLAAFWVIYSPCGVVLRPFWVQFEVLFVGDEALRKRVFYFSKTSFWEVGESP